MNCTVKSKRMALGVVMSLITTVGFIMIGLAIAAKAPFNKNSDSSLTSNRGYSGTPLPSGTPELSPPVGRLMGAGLALLRRGLPLDVMGPILLNVNEWKDLTFAFNRTPQTAQLLDLIDQYPNARSAAKGGNDDPEWLRFGRLRHGEIVTFRLSSNSFMEIDKEGRIVNLRMTGLADTDIRDLSFLPQSLRVLWLTEGSIKHINLSKLPRRLEHVLLCENQISEMVIESVPPSLRGLSVLGNPLKQGITFKTPLPNGLLVVLDILRNVPLNLNGGHRDERNVVTWQSGRTITLA